MHQLMLSAWKKTTSTTWWTTRCNPRSRVATPVTFLMSLRLACKVLIIEVHFYLNLCPYLMGQQRMSHLCFRVFAELQRYLRQEPQLTEMLVTAPTRKSKTGSVESARSACHSSKLCLMTIKVDAPSSSKFATRISSCKIFYQSRSSSLSRLPPKKGASSLMQVWAMKPFSVQLWVKKGTQRSYTNATSRSMWQSCANTWCFASQETCKQVTQTERKRKACNKMRPKRTIPLAQYVPITTLETDRFINVEWMLII